MSRVISADCHINEPPWVFDRMPAELRERAPRIVQGTDGGDGWSFDGGPPKRTFGIEAMAGRAKDDYQRSGLRFEDILPGNYDGAAHVADMELDGVSVSVVYPNTSIFTYLEPDRRLALACMRSYNDWILDEFQAADPARLVGLPMLPVDDGMDVCVEELARVQANGARAAFIPGMPERPYNSPYYEPLWRAAEERGMPLTFHRTFGGKPADVDWEELVQMDVSAAGTTNRFFAGVRPLTYAIFDGVFEAHPGLRLVAAEVNFGWVPFWAQTMDQQHDNYLALNHRDPDAGSRWPLSRRPSEYLGTNVFVTVLDDHVGFGLLRQGYEWLADMAMWSSDYPHSVTLWPRSREHIEQLTHGLSASTRDTVLAGNATRVYGL